MTLPQVRYGLSLLLMEMFCTLSIASICRQVQRQLMRNELARFYHHRTRNCIPQLSYVETYSRSILYYKNYCSHIQAETSSRRYSRLLRGVNVMDPPVQNGFSEPE